MTTPYIILGNSNDSLSKYFRVLTEGYDDGTLNRTENISQLVGGGIDHSMGAVYHTWSPIIRVRQSEPDSGYGSLANLETLYSYNNPNGTPSNTLKFTSHHGGSPVNVHIVGSFQKQIMGCQIEGNEAWFLVKLQLIEV